MMRFSTNYIILFLLIGAALAAVADSLTLADTESNRISTCQDIKKYSKVLTFLEKFWKYLSKKYNCDGKPSIKKQGLTCGLREKQKMSIALKIAGGKDAGSWPWAISLFMSKDERLPDCAGTLIADRWVVTSAFCIAAHRKSMKLPRGRAITNGFTGDQTPFVRVGDRELLDDGDRYEQRIEVSKVILHPNFKETRFDNHNDIALLQLKKKVSLNDHVNVACLPDQHFNLTAGTRCKAVGWGMKGRGNNVTSPLQLHVRLQEVEMPLISHEQCQRRLIMSSLKTSMHVCAGGEDGKGTRGGDSGAPLLCSKLVNGRKHWYLYGVTSFENGYDGKTYDVFTRVSSYSDWIERMQSLYNEA